MSVKQDKWQKFERLMGSACRQGYVLLPRKPKTDGGEQCSRSQVGIAGNIARSAVWLAHSAVESVAAPKARSKRIGRFGRLVRASGSGSTSASVRQRPNRASSSARAASPRPCKTTPRRDRPLPRRKFESAPSLASRGGRRDNLFKITLASQHAEPFDLRPAHADLQVRQSAQIRRGGSVISRPTHASSARLTNTSVMISSSRPASSRIFLVGCQRRPPCSPSIKRALMLDATRLASISLPSG